jgi:siroheme synthase
MTGHRSAEEGGAEPTIELPRYDARTTYVVFMALGRLAEVAAAAMNRGFPADLPALLVSKATLADERWVAAPLDAIAESAAAAAIEAPATLLIGRVAERLARTGSEREGLLAELTAPAARRPAS